MNPEIQHWLESHKHLPGFLRDFHDQKDLFKTIQRRYGDNPEYPDWIRAQCYTIDRFLWFMAQHGYTLRRSRAKLPFYSLGATVKADRDAETEQIASVLNSIVKPKG